MIKFNKFIKFRGQGCPPYDTISNAYYNGTNFVLKNPNAIPEFIESYLPGIPSYSIYGYAGGGASIGYSYDKLNQDIKNTINWFKSHD